MQKIFFSLIMTLFGVVSFSQNISSTLTKGETVAYLNKKIKEAVGHKLSNNNGYIGEIIDAKLESNEKGIKIEYCWSGTNSQYYWSRFVFNPANIVDITPYANTTESAINEMGINLVGKICVKTTGTGYYSGTTTTESVAYSNFAYLRADPENITKIKKALLYLKSLLKAEDDPFAN